MFPMMIGMENKGLSQNMKPIRIYRLLQSICNFEAEEYIPTKDLAKVGRLKIFDFDYPLTDKVSRETFEINILEHFMNRRIGFETPTAFKISLKAKLNEIMPSYNKMFDMLDGWDLFKDGETINKTTTIEYDESGDYEKTNTGTDNISNTGTNTVKNTGTDTTVNSGTDTNVESGRIDTVDKNSDMPQSDLGNVQDDDYLTNYKINEKTFNNHQNQRTLNLQNQETLNTQNQQTLNTQNLRTANLKENNEHNKNIDETITEKETHTEKDKIKIYKEFLENRTSIYTMIFDDLETCFYGLL
jgi:hypothetical protein